MKNKILSFITETEQLLKSLRGNCWAETWVNKRMEFFRLFHENLITTTMYGAEYFNAVQRHLNGEKLPPIVTSGKDKTGEYELNYHFLIRKWLTN